MVKERWHEKVGAVITLSKSVSEADVALFGLISRDDAFVAEDPAPPMRKERQMAPYPFLASLVATAASHLISPKAQAGFLRQHVEFSWPMYSDDRLSMLAEVVAYDEAAQTITISVVCHNQDQQRLAQGEFILDVTSSEES